MAIHQGPYVGARDCTGSATSGARALMSWYLGAYAEEGGRNLGIYNCRPVAGGARPSLHSEGRACDLGNPVGVPWQQQLADLLVANSAELGIQGVIYDRRIWTNAYPNNGWRQYTGPDPHVDHIHAELTWDAAGSLTAARVQEVLGDPSPVHGGGAPPVPSGGRFLKLTKPLMKGDDVHAVQVRLLELGYPLPRFGADRSYGEETLAAVRLLQARAGIRVDGVVGPDVRDALARGVRNTGA